MSLFATEVTLQPYFVEAPVIADSGNRILYVKRPESESGYGLLLWRECHAALLRAQETGWRTGYETVWAGVTGDSRIANAVAVPNLKLMFRFPPDSTTGGAYQRLITTPGLVARVQMDRSATRLISVRFTNVRS